MAALQAAVKEKDAEITSLKSELAAAKTALQQRDRDIVALTSQRDQVCLCVFQPNLHVLSFLSHAVIPLFHSFLAIWMQQSLRYIF